MRILYLLITVCLISNVASTQSSAAEEIHLVQGILPPYAIPENDSGIEVDIIRTAMSKKGHTVKIRYVPFGRVARDFSRSKSDAGSPLAPSSGIIAEYSDSHLVYENVAVTLDENGLEIKNINQLGIYRVVAFTDAKIFLGSVFAGMANGNSEYREVGNQINQNRLLHKKRVDVTIGDYRIFQYYDKKLASEEKLKPIKFHRIFSPTPYNVAFKDERLRDDFNAGLQEMRSTGEYEKIISKYTETTLIN